MVEEVVVKFKKNIAAKLTTVIASTAAFGSVWALAHANPPATARLATAATSTPVTDRAATTSRATVPTPAATQKRNTRTRAS